MDVLGGEHTPHTKAPRAVDSKHFFNTGSRIGKSTSGEGLFDIYQDGSFSWHCCLNFGRLKTSGLGFLYISVCFQLLAFLGDWLFRDIKEDARRMD